MTEETIITRSPTRAAISWIIRGVLCCVVILFFLLMTQSVVIIEVPIHFGFGWLFHAIKTIPPLLGNWRGFLLPMGCLTLAGVLIHRFVRRSLDAKGPSPRWRPVDTVAAMSLLLLGCGAAIALSGIVHQSVWLMSDRWTENRGRRIHLTVGMSNARQLLLALYEFHESEGHYPNSLRELEGKFIDSPKLAWVQTETGSLVEPFILLKPGGTMSTTDVEPLIVSPIFKSSQKIVVGYSDHSVRTLPAGQLDLILKGGGKRKTEITPQP